MMTSHHNPAYFARLVAQLGDAKSAAKKYARDYPQDYDEKSPPTSADVFVTLAPDGVTDTIAFSDCVKDPTAGGA